MSNIIYVQKGSKLSISNNRLLVNVEEEKRYVPIHEISAVVIENLQCSITAGVNVLCSENNVPIIYCDNKHHPNCISNSFHTYHKQLSRIKEQLQWTESKKKKLFKEIIKQKILNQLELLRYLNKDVSIIKEIENKLKNIDNDNFENIEAIVARLYFNELFGKDFIRGMEGEINLSLNYGYAILRSIIKQTIVAKGLIPSIGLWHKSQFNNFNLSDDIIEVFRPMVDYITFHFLIRDEDFITEEKIYLQNSIFQKVKYGNNIFEYRDCVNLYIDQIIKYMNKEIKEIIIPILDSELYEY